LPNDDIYLPNDEHSTKHFSMHSGNFLHSARKQVPDVYSYIPAISGQEF